jgi:hypothetical protein
VAFSLEQIATIVVDYISFNITGFTNTESIAKYLFEKFNFNSTFAKGQNGIAKSWFYLLKNQHQVSFRQYNNFIRLDLVITGLTSNSKEWKQFC